MSSENERNEFRQNQTVPKIVLYAQSGMPSASWGCLKTKKSPICPAGRKARRAGAGVGTEARHPAAGRADQRFGHRHAGIAGRTAARLRRYRVPRQPRPYVFG